MRPSAKIPTLLIQNYSKISLRLVGFHPPHNSWSSFTSHWDFPFPAAASQMHEGWSCFLPVCSPVFPMQGRLPFEFWSRAHCSRSTSQPEISNFTSGNQLLSQMILRCITTKPQGCSNHPLSANSIPLPDIRKQEHTWPSLLGASNGWPT